MDNNNIQFIDQRLANLRLLIAQCRAQSAAAEKCLGNTIITLKIKRINAIHPLEKRLGEHRALIPLYTARFLTYEHLLAKQIINLDFQLIAPKPKQFLQHLFALHLPEQHPLIYINLHNVRKHHFTRNRSNRTATITIKRYCRNSH